MSRQVIVMISLTSHIWSDRPKLITGFQMLDGSCFIRETSRRIPANLKRKTTKSRLYDVKRVSLNQAAFSILREC
jgi:hypothetical protein